jgi:hypothetical protein
LNSPTEFDFIIIDGDHRIDNTRNELEILKRRPPMCFMAHDTNSTACGIGWCEGPPLFKQWFQTTAPYLCLEDNFVREGEDTRRGMFLATTSPEIFEKAREALRVRL